MRILFAFLLLAVTAAIAIGSDAPEGIANCSRCGMDRTRFAYSRTIVTYADGTTVGLCSLHCAVEEMMKSAGKKISSLKVADFDSRNLVAAETATWVTGGKVKGIMTMPAKWAFAGKEDASAFVRYNGGEITPYQEVLRAVQDEVTEMEKMPEME
jgi:copper chaperone NosL